MLLKWIAYLRRRPLFVILFVSLLLFGAIVFITFLLEWDLQDPNNVKVYLLILGSILAITTFIADRIENIYERHIKVQLEFFDRWQKIKSDIELGEKPNAKKKMTVNFNRYFELLSLEHLMNVHIGSKVLNQWNKSRTLEFKDKTRYSRKAFKKWWDEYKDKMANEEFKNQMDDYKDEADNDSK